ncbi:MAG: methyltransferase domain-containing protein [Methanobacteriota archaeon]|nr:MAG: methyltransferase domain-containing protein [Euryarchaeota archaeon]TLZ72766.1 MAG: methyltransferase domain-containing protein [Euryarchaeota archaeon]
MDDERLDDEGLLFLEMRSELGHADGTCVAGINPCGTRSLYRGARVRRAPVNANEATLVWVDEYSRMAEAYDQNVAPRFEPIAQEVVHLADPKPNELFLDVGTGTGLLACLLAPRVLPQGVVAIDLADGAISVASYRAGNAGIRNIRFEMLDSRNIVYHGKLFDGVASNLGVPALGYDRVFHEVYRVLKTSGRFVFSEWPTDPNPSFAALRELLEKHGTRSPSKDLVEVREAVRLVRSDPEAKALGDPRAVLEALRVQGFDRRESMKKEFPVRFASPDELVRFAASYGFYERELREMPPESHKAFDAELAARLRPLTTSAGIEDIWTVNFFIAHPE